MRWVIKIESEAILNSTVETYLTCYFHQLKSNIQQLEATIDELKKQLCSTGEELQSEREHSTGKNTRMAPLCVLLLCVINGM